MKNIILLSFLCLPVLSSFAQDLDKNAAINLVKNNAKAIGLTEEGVAGSIVSSAYVNDIAGTQMVYLQQGYKGLPVFNKIQTLAFKNGKLVSASGDWIKNIQQLDGLANAQPSVTAVAAVKTAMASKNIFPSIAEASRPVNGVQKVEFGKMEVSLENVTAELMWVSTEGGKSVALAWQVFFAPKTSANFWLIRINANNNTKMGETNLTLSCGFDLNAKHDHVAECALPSAIPENPATSQFKGESLAIVNGASYRVVPVPAESPKHNNGTPVLVTNPWTAAPGNATTLKWHSDGTNDYNYTRGNNVWAYHDRGNTNTPSVANSAMSTTTPDPLTFNFIPDFTNAPNLPTTQNQQFNITNLFYWNNVTHDVLYQYGFTEAAGNFQASNLGRGGLGNDYLLAEAQDGNGTNNANFSTPADGGRPRMQMYLWDGPSKTVVNSPSSIAGTYESVEGVFSTANRLISVGPVTAQLVYYIDSIAPTNDACTQASNPAAIAGKIALINRNTCSFVIKVKNAQLAGAVGVIMVNNVAGAPIAMGGTDNSITIPAVMISQSDGAILAGQLANNVNVTLSAVSFDGDVDNGIIVHEYAHGISNRLTGGPAAAGCLGNAEQAGEGWSDYYALMLTQDWATSNLNSGFTNPRGIGTYVIGETSTGLGIRSQKYSTDFTVNNLVYLNNLPGTGLQHSRGEIWAATLWDMTWNIIKQVNSITPDIYNASGTGGNIIALKLVTEGLKLQPCNPGFIDGRDAILKADQILFNGQYSCAIREAFRRRGMGFYASQGDGNSASDQVPDYTPYLTFTLKPSVTQALEGSNITYTHTISTCGALDNYIIRDTLPSNVTYISGGSYDAASRVVSFPVNLASAGAQSYAFTVSINAGSYYAPTTYLNETVPTAAFPTTLTQASTNATTWTVSSAQSHSAPNSLFSGNAIVISDETLTTTDAITLGTKQSSLSFWHLYDTEAKYDGGVIEISTDNGVTWSDLGEKITAGYYNGTMDAATGTPIAGRKAYTGTITDFIKTEVNLSSYAGMSTKYRWRFNADDGTAQTGWYVDDILVKNEAVANMRASLFNTAGTRIIIADTVTLITLACSNIAITAQPVNTTGCAGGSASFTVTATGSNPLYQWQASTDGGATYTNIAGATAATLTLTSVTAGMNNNRYRVIVSNTCPSSVTSTGATLSVSTPTTISSQPASVTVCSGANTSFTVSATGAGVTYQWQVSTDGGTTFTNITGATSATLSLTSVTTAMNNNQYRAVLSSCSPGGVISNAATLTVNSPATITTQPASVVACTGNNATFTVAASGTSNTYQWQMSTDGGTTWTNIAGANATSYSVTSATAAMNGNQYRVLVNGTCVPASVTSSVATLTVNNSITITTQPMSVAVCAGANVTFTTAATGSGLTYQWQVSINGGTTFTNITGATTATLNLPAVTPAQNGNQYKAVLNGACVSNLSTSVATLTVYSSVTITTQPTNQIGCAPAPATFTVVAIGTSITYQWQISTNGGTTWTNIPGATSTTYTIPSLSTSMNTNQFRVIATGSPCGSVTSNAATLVVGNLPMVNITASPSTTLSPASTTILSVTVTPIGTYNYQWFRNDVAVSGATGSSLSVSADGIGIYKVRASSSNGCSNFSDTLSLTASASEALFVYPNPNRGIFQVRYYNAGTSTVKRSISVYDSKGSRVYYKQYDAAPGYTKMEVVLSKAMGGLYTVDVRDSNEERIATSTVLIK